MTLRNRVSRVTPSTAGRPEIITNFYREEFLKHKRLLNRQREYYSERAITEVEAALTRAIAQLEQLCHHDNADKVVSDLLRKLDVVTNLSAWSDPKNAH
jgi:hypothetical protein